MVRRMSSTVKDSQGNEVNSEMEELMDLKTENKILKELEPIKALLAEIKSEVKEVKSKVIIHNNYENRIRSLEANQWKIMGVYTGILAVISIIFFILK